jgi:AcrR family transcriptional regulator
MADHRRATAERNLEAILDAAEALLERGAQASIAAVAKESGVSRVTVYAHFETREALLEAVVERAVGRAATAIDAAEPEAGPALDAFDRVVAAGWGELHRTPAIARAAAEQLGAAAMERSHDAARTRVLALITRGREEGAFRTDLAPEWLLAAVFALIHACGDEVRAGRLAAADALAALTATLHGALAP